MQAVSRDTGRKRRREGEAARERKLFAHEFCAMWHRGSLWMFRRGTQSGGRRRGAGETEEEPQKKDMLWEHGVEREKEKEKKNSLGHGQKGEAQRTGWGGRKKKNRSKREKIRKSCTEKHPKRRDVSRRVSAVLCLKVSVHMDMQAVDFRVKRGEYNVENEESKAIGHERSLPAQTQVGGRRSTFFSFCVFSVSFCVSIYLSSPAFFSLPFAFCLPTRLEGQLNGMGSVGCHSGETGSTGLDRLQFEAISTPRPGGGCDEKAEKHTSECAEKERAAQNRS